MKISHSAKDRYITCPKSYKLHYIDRIRPDTQKSALAFGSAIDDGLNYLLTHKNLEQAILTFEVAWSLWQDKKIDYSKSDLELHLVEDIEGDDTFKTWVSLLRRGTVLLEEYHSQVLPLIKEVIAVQVDRTVFSDDGDELVIKADFIAKMHDDKIILFDNKTSTAKYAEDSVRKSEQLAIYFEHLKSEFNLDAAGFIVIPKKINKRKEPRVLIKIIVDKIDTTTLHTTLEQYDNVIEGVKSEYFPEERTSCYGKFGKCQFYNLCHHGSMKGLVKKD